MELQTAQALYDKSLCIIPDCTAISSKIPDTLKQTSTNTFEYSMITIPLRQTPSSSDWLENLLSSGTASVGS
jgi:hypothetical protein